jgi:hypothetical protein
MSCIPSIESILLEIHQSFGLGSFTTKQKSSFAQLKRPLEKHRAQFRDIFDEITQLHFFSKGLRAKCLDFQCQ